MSKHSFLLKRFINYYQKKGLSGTLRRLLEQPRRIFKGYTLLIYAELKEVEDAVFNLPGNIIIECRRNYDEILQPDMQKLADHWRKAKIIHRIKERFELGAILR